MVNGKVYQELLDAIEDVTKAPVDAIFMQALPAMGLVKLYGVRPPLVTQMQALPSLLTGKVAAWGEAGNAVCQSIRDSPSPHRMLLLLRWTDGVGGRYDCNRETRLWRSRLCTQVGCLASHSAGAIAHSQTSKRSGGDLRLDPRGVGGNVVVREKPVTRFDRS